MKTLHMVPQRYQHFFLPPVVAFWWFNGVRAPSEMLAELEDEEVMLVAVLVVLVRHVEWGRRGERVDPAAPTPVTCSTTARGRWDTDG